MGLGMDKFNGLKSLNRIDGMIDKGYIKRIYVDVWYKQLEYKLVELFGDKVEICTLYMHKSIIDTIDFKETDCLILFETIWNEYKRYEVLIKKAKEHGVFVKILTEDIFNLDYLCDNRAKEIENYNKDFKLVTKNIYALDKLKQGYTLVRLKDGYDTVQIEDEWNDISKGYNFILKLGDMYYSVDYLDRVLD